MTVRVIDVSRWQGPIDWRAVKRSGVAGAWIKVGGADGGYYRDSRAGENVAGAEAAGLPYGTYYFCVPDTDPRGQARHAVSCGHGRGVMWPAPDIETNPNRLSPEALDRWATEFCNETMRVTGRESVVYTNRDTVGHTSSAPSHCPLWIANYGGNRPGTVPPNFQPQLPRAWSRWDAWQFNSTTRVDGIPGNTVDQNVVTDDLWARMTTGAPPSPPPEEDDMPVTTHIWITEPGSPWFAEHGGQAGGQGVFKALNTDQFVRAVAPPEVEGHHNLRDLVEASGGTSSLVENGEVPDWFFSDRTLLPRDWPTTAEVDVTVPSWTPEQVAGFTAELRAAVVAELEQLPQDVLDELAGRLTD